MLQRHFFRIFLALLGMMLTEVRLHAQLDTEFWFAAPEVWANHGDQPIVLRFSTLDQAAVVSVSQPANPGFPVQNVAIGAYGTMTLNLTPWIDDIENTPFNTVLPQGLHIESDVPITAYYEINNLLNPDIFTLKGQSALGEEFYVPFQNYLPNFYTQSKAGIDIVATEDNTEITIIPTTNLVGYPQGVPFTISLNQGETYALRAANANAVDHPTGTYITSTAPIAVTISDDSLLGTPGSCQDILGDQIIPVDLAGEEYIAVKGNLNGPDKVFLVGTEDNTSININGLNVWTLGAGETYAHTLTAATAYYETSAPVVALHMTGFGCEVGGAVLPPIQCTGSSEVAFFRSTTSPPISNEFFGMKIIVPSGAEGDFSLNGSAANVGPLNFSAVPGTGGEWMYANITGTGFIPVNQASRLSNGTAKFHLGIIHGGPNNGTRYGYFSDFANYQHTTYTSDDQLCAGEMAELFASPILDATYDWIGPNGFTATGNELEIGPLSTDDAGIYIVSGMAGDCEILPDTLELFVAPQPPMPDVVVPDPLCEGDAWDFTTTTSADVWIWSDDAGNVVSSDSTDGFTNAGLADAGTYTLVVETENCLSAAAEFELIVYETVEAPLNGDDIEICEGNSLILEPNGTAPNVAWEWTAPDGSTTLDEILFIATTASNDAGTYTLSGTSNGCPMTPATVDVTLSTPTAVTLTVPDFICNDAGAIAVETDDVYAGSWNATCANCVSSSGVITPSSTGPGFVVITYTSQNPCEQTAEVTVEIGAVPDASIEDLSSCLGTGDVNLISTTAGGTWVAECAGCCAPSGVFNTVSAGVGTWDLTYTIDGACPSSSTGTFTVTANTSSDFTLAPTACANDAPVIAIADEPGGAWTATCGTCVGASSGQFSPASAGVGQHTVTYTIPGACGTTTSAVIAVLALPDPGFSFTPSEGCAPAVVECTAPLNPAVTNCQWTYAQNGVGASLSCEDNIFVLEDPGCYQLTHTVTDGAGCTNSLVAPNLLCLSAPPSSDFAISPAHPSLFDPLLEVWATDSVAENDYLWEVAGAMWLEGPSQVLSIPDIGEDVFNLCLQVVDSVECSSLTCHPIELTEGLNAYAPNAFTPDNDGHNDAWRMYVSGSVTRFELQIFDRWGALVFATTDPEEHWVGEVMGGAHFAPDGVYHFQAVLRDDAYQIKTLQGHILLIR